MSGQCKAKLTELLESLIAPSVGTFYMLYIAARVGVGVWNLKPLISASVWLSLEKIGVKKVHTVWFHFHESPSYNERSREVGSRAGGEGNTLTCGGALRTSQDCVCVPFLDCGGSYPRPGICQNSLNCMFGMDMLYFL